MHTTVGPKDNEEPFDEYPLTCALASSIRLRDTTWDGDKGLFVWDDRSDSGPADRPNGLRDNIGAIRNSTGQECRTRFSDIPRAMASTEARIAHHLGYPSSVVDGIIARAGFDPGRDKLYLEEILQKNTIDQTFDVATDSQGSRTRGQGDVVYACT